MSLFLWLLQLNRRCHLGWGGFWGHLDGVDGVLVAR